jgi:kynurenine formamidase
MLIQLSYALSEHTPFYPSLPKPQLRQIYSLAKGDVCNSYYLTTSNHAGTHVDAPRHFSASGRSIGDYGVAELVFGRPALLDLPLNDDELIEPSRLDPVLAPAATDADILLLRSGYGRFRTDEARYIGRSPGFGPEAAALLMARFPKLKALAVDFVSISAAAHEAAGAGAHRVFLGCGDYASRPILLVEDAFLPAGLPRLERVFVIPWMFEGLDSAPCVMFAEAANG